MKCEVVLHHISVDSGLAFFFVTIACRINRKTKYKLYN
jgi:hypothetical protein